MQKMIQTLLAVAFVVACLCGPASAQQAEKDWYVALRLGYQPYTTEMDGTLLDRDFSAKADLSDIMDKTDTTLAGGEVEFGKRRWFVTISSSYQKTEAESGGPSLGVQTNFKEVNINPMLGYQVYQENFSGGRSLTIGAMAGLSYIKVSWDISLYNPVKGSISRSDDFEAYDPMVGLRLRYMFTRKFGVAALGQIGGFGVGTELQYTAAAHLIYSFNDWFAMTAGYRYWYFKYEDDSANLREITQKVYGPTLGVEFRF